MRKLAVFLGLVLTVSAAHGVFIEPSAAARFDSLKFAVIGDNGNGQKAQYDVGDQMAKSRAEFPYDMVIMLGDNLYGSQGPKDFVTKFEKPYEALLTAGVTFYATLGNHDAPDNKSYPAFHMGGERYYTYVKHDVRFVVLDSNRMDPPQVAWFEQTLKASAEPWKIVYFHHPLYSDAGRHGPDVELRVVLEPLMVKYGVNAVFSGHEHIYERIKPQKGITYFIAGSGGQLARGDLNPSAETAAGFDQDQAFMLVDITSDTLSFRTISRTGRVVDSGTVVRLQ